jgi:glycosyltransferase involved in cell wall biosynthesis
MKLRLLHVISSCNPAHGGPIEGLTRQIEATQDQRESEIISLDLPDDPWVSTAPFKVYPVGTVGTLPGPLRHWGYSKSLVPWLKRYARNYDAVIVHGLWNYAAFGASRVLPGGPTPYFVFTHGMMDPWFRKTYPLKHAAKQVFWAIGEGRLMEGAKSVFFTSEEERLLARGQFLGHPYIETVVGYGTSAPPAPSPAQIRAFRDAAPALGDRPYLLFLSRIHFKKGCDLLIEAFARTCDLQQDLQLVIAGPGTSDLVDSLRDIAKRLGVSDRIHWPGMLQGDAKWGAFHGADAFILPSHQENFGIVVAEAMACSRPVLITDKVNIWREVEAAGAGLVEADTAEGATRLIRRWLTLDPQGRQRMSVAAARAFHEKFDVTTLAPELVATIRTML